MQSNRKKLLLIGRSGSGKSSMRSIIFSNYSAMDTHRLGATIDVEHSHLRFLGNMTLNLWDCGGQNLFIENYLTTQRDHIFRVVEVLIYVFDIGSKEVPKDMETFSRVLGNLQEFSPDAKVFVLLHKMDLVRADRRQQVYDATMTSIRSSAQQFKFKLEGFATSIWDESLYKAWSSIVCSLITNMGNLQKKLSEFVDLTCASEAILFERTTFLVISHIASQNSTNASVIAHADPQRFEKISNIVKSFRQSCSKLHSQLQSVTLKTAVGIVVINSLTANTFVMVVLRDNVSSVNLVQSNINSARKQFEAIEKQTTAPSALTAQASG